MSRFFCAAAAEDRGEAATGTASRIDRWLLVETSGAWSARALPATRDLDDRALLALQRRAAASHARTLLVRRPGAGGRTGSGRRVFVADSRPGHERLLTRSVTDDQLADLDLPYGGEAPGWDASPALIGVCTHGGHDPCCAVRGRPVVAALAGSHPELTWEVSHIGGDRFAANALVLPGGHYLGRLTAASASAAVEAVLTGHRPDPHYRGRSCWSTPAQAALALTEERFGETRLDALRPTLVERDGERRWRVGLARGQRRWEATVVQDVGPARSRLTCGAAEENGVPAGRLVQIVETDPESTR